MHGDELTPKWRQLITLVDLYCDINEQKMDREYT